MRLFRYQAGRFQPVSLAATGVASAPEIEDAIRRSIKSHGSVDSLCLDFCGSFVPLVHEDELCLVARLLACYHNSLLPAGPASWSGASSPCGPDTDEYYLGSPILRRRGGRAGRALAAVVATTTNEDNYYSAASGVSGDSGDSDSEDEKQTRERLAWEFEQNEDIEAAPCFGKTGLVYW